MKNWKISPKDLNIAKYVDCYWFLEKEPSDVGNNRPKLNPDPSAHLIIAGTDHKYHYEQNSSLQKGNGSHWIYPHRNTFVMNHSEPFGIIGIKFRVGALYAMAHLQPTLTLDRISPADINSLVGDASFCARHCLANIVESSTQARDSLDHILGPWLLKSREDRHSELTRNVLPLLSTTAVAKLGSMLHRSQRTVERSFLRTTSLTLKQCQSMIRLEQMLDYLYKFGKTDINWLDVASRFEFSDQPHLIRHLRQSIGETPSEYLQKRDLTIDIYGDFELS